MLLELVDIAKTYQSQYGRAIRRVLDGVNLRVAPGERIAVVGPSGSGKTTLLNIMGTLDRPDAGRVTLSGVDLLGQGAERLLEIRSRRIGFVFQQHHLLPQCTLWENVLIPTLPIGARRHGGYARAEALLRGMGLWEYRFQKPAELSGGECQRAAVARALINGPEVLLADEPTGSLDQANARELVELLNGVNRAQGLAIVMVTHSLPLARTMDRVLELVDGRLRELPRSA